MVDERTMDVLLEEARSYLLKVIYDIQKIAYAAGESGSPFPDLSFSQMGTVEKTARVVAAAQKTFEVVQDMDEMENQMATILATFQNEIRYNG